MDDMLNNNTMENSENLASENQEQQTNTENQDVTTATTEEVAVSSAGGTDEASSTEDENHANSAEEDAGNDEDSESDDDEDEATADDSAANNPDIPRDEMAVALINQKIGENIILYGVPGCGKSHTIQHNFPAPDTCKTRVVFHQDYTYSDFVGQILPKTDSAGNISYDFKAGPFTEILKQAKNDTKNMYYLIVEEINRGNAPAIFGDLFQLLDRNDKGVSEYGIYNADMAKHIYGDETAEIKIPANLTILATMNTADQNVFTLDTAFKRRWRMCCIRNNVDSWSKNPKICNTNVRWKEFVKKINNLIVDNNEGTLSNEDKRLGIFFVKPNDLNNMQLFAEKVLMYLWNDAFKYNRDKVFKSDAKTLEDLIDEFYVKGFEIFVDELKFNTSITPSNKLKITAPATAVTLGGGSSSGGTKMSVPDRLKMIEAKDPALYKLYEDIRDEVKKRIPKLEEGDNYAAWNMISFRTNPIDHSRKYFAVFQFQPDNRKWVLFVDDSSELRKLPSTSFEKVSGQPLPFMLSMNSSTDPIQIADAIEGSYKTLKAQFKP